MTKRKTVFFMAILLVFLPVMAYSQEITIVSHELKPFTWEERGTVKGLAYDLIAATMQKLNIKSEIKLVPFKRALLMVQQGSNTAMFHVQRTAERENTMKWVGPIITNDVYVYCHKKGARRIHSLDDMRKLKHIAVVNGEATDEFLTKRGFTNLIRVRKQSQSLEMIINGNAEASAFGELVLEAYAEDGNIDISQIEKTGIKLFESDLYIGFSKDVPDDIIATWQKALNDVKKNQYSTLYKKYIHGN